jgi:hypothetical protein
VTAAADPATPRGSPINVQGRQRMVTGFEQVYVLRLMVKLSAFEPLRGE